MAVPSCLEAFNASDTWDPLSPAPVAELATTNKQSPAIDWAVIFSSLKGLAKQLRTGLHHLFNLLKLL